MKKEGKKNQVFIYYLRPPENQLLGNTQELYIRFPDRMVG